ncbi:hypothetical protein [Costertonia aggregata]|uniref:Uncharacterized protein n=1 Tax=Costertonia aggregata TaxID=343403 RepID=A0A7H9AQN4_9FLAO|nr:hypothetical protein [Costertonia aggregata]QLG45717.1 hypothetical protein HYG79_10280 [Costertonia aggregata]
MKIANKIVSILIILVNFYFVPLSFIIIEDTGGPMGYGLLVLPISIVVNFLLVTATFALKLRFNKSIGLFVFNSLGLVWSLFWLRAFLTTNH